MKSWKTPTPERIEKAVAQLGHGEYNRYFFDRLDNPEWLRPLKAKGFFGAPPQPIHDESRGTIAFPPWPESRYLARMAKYAPETVLEIALAIPQTENVHVHTDLADAALAMPSASAAKLVAQAKEWIKFPYQLMLPQKLGALVNGLALGGEGDAALDLLGALLELQPDPKPILVPEPRARFDSWHYQEIVRKEVPDLVRATGMRALELLGDILDRALQLSTKDQDGQESEDYSSIWRPAIDYDAGSSREVTGALVSAVRDAALELVTHDLASVGQVVQALEKRRWQVFHRIALHVLRAFADRAPGLVAERLRDPGKFDYAGIRREYNLLASEWFGRLGEADQDNILHWIDLGPDLELYKERWGAFTGQPVTDEDAQRYKERWQRDRLATFSLQLPEKWKTYYEQLVGREGHAEDLTEGRRATGGAFAPGSPKKSEDLGKMAVAEVITYLQSWQPSGEFLGDTIAGLARELGGAVAANPEPFAAQAREFSVLDPTYVREFLQALTAQAKQKVPFDWNEVLGLARWVSEQPKEMPGRKGGLTDRDPDWGWTRSTIARLLAAGFESDTIPFALRGEVWLVIELLAKDSDPTPKDEVHYLRGENADPGSLAINSTRGEVMSDVVRYALWVRGKIESGENGAKRLKLGFDEMPEARQVIADHLDPKIDPSLAIRSVYGRWLPWLHLVDRAWVEANLANIFPDAENLRALRDSAWTAYIVHCDAYNDVFELLRAEYLHEMDQIGKHAHVGSHLGHPDERLAAHLMTMYWRGKLPIHDALLHDFYWKAPDKLRGYAMEFVGRSLRNDTGAVAPEIIERLRELWASRLDAARAAGAGTSYVEELARFGWWFASKKFDDAWAVGQLAEALRITKKAEPDHLVVERLAELSASLPRTSVECLGMMVAGDKEGWGVLGWRESARKILGEAMNSADDFARTAAADVIHRLGARGYFEFGELLPVAPE
jgi:hypothetical protein